MITLRDLSWTGQLHYLASPYSKYPSGIDDAWREVSYLAARLLERGVPIFCPISHSHPIAKFGGLDPYSHDLWLPADQPLMRACGAMIIAKMNGWDTSYGVSEEIKHFEKAGKPIYTVEPGSLRVETYGCA